MIFWIVISIVFGFMFGYILGYWSTKDALKTMGNLKQEYKVTNYSENLEHLIFNKEIKREDAYNMDTDLIERIVSIDIAEQIRPYIKDKMISEYDSYKMAAIYKFDLWVRR